MHVPNEGGRYAARALGLTLSVAALASLLLVLAAIRVGQAGQQQHPAVLAGAPETAAPQLQRELGRKGKLLVIDVRGPQEYAQGHVPGAINIPIEELQKRIEEMKVPRDTTLVTVCEHGGRSSRAAVELRKLGYKTSSFCRLEGWKKEGYKLETGGGATGAAPKAGS